MVPPRNPRALANSCKTLIEDPDLRKQLGTNARSFLINNFSWKKIAEETTLLYKNITENFFVSNKP